MIISTLRKNIGTIIACLGFILLCIFTYGNLGEIATEAYWVNVKNNLTSIGFLSVGLTMIQVTIKQGVSEQALQRGLNTPLASSKYTEHRSIITKNTGRMIYLPYFLRIYNERHTALKKKEFLVDNNYPSERHLLASKHRKHIRRYRQIRIQVTANRIKWATTDINYNKYGQIQTLQEHRNKRLVSGIVAALFFMFASVMLARGLFFDKSEVSFLEKTVKLLGYMAIITVTSILAVVKEYEKGAFGVPNELDEINQIWFEFENWTVPEHIIKEVEAINEERTDVGTSVQEQSPKVESVQDAGSDSVLLTSGVDGVICNTGIK